MSDYTIGLIALTTTKGFTVTKVEEIVCCVADGSYTSIQLADGTSHKLSKRLTKIEQALPGELFIRVHHHYLVNMIHVKKYTRNDGSIFLLSNGQRIPVAERRRKSVLEKFKVL